MFIVIISQNSCCCDVHSPRFLLLCELTDSMSIATESLGLSFKISPELKDTLKSKSTARFETTFSESSKLPVSLVPLTRRRVEQHETVSDTDHSLAAFSESVAGHDEQNDQVVQHDGASETSEPIMEVSAPRSLDETFSEQDNLGEQSDDELSYSPPPTRPAVLVNLEKLCGYLPNTETELEAVIVQVKAALNEDEFDERVAELFEMNIVRHGDCASVVSDIFRTLRVDYPEFLCTPDGRIVSTARVWKKFFRGHKIPVVNRILNHLKRCNRPLLWKSDMCDALLDLARREDTARRDAELDKWRSVDRKVHLDRLYQVRETFCHRLEMAAIALEKLEDDRDRQVARQPGRGLQGLDHTSNIFAADEQWLHAGSLLGEHGGESDSVDGDEASCEDTVDEGIVDDSFEAPQIAQHENPEVVDDVKHAENGIRGIASRKANRRRTRGSRRYRECLENAAQQALEKKTIDAAVADQAILLEQFTSEELLKAQAIVQSLQVRTQQVDDLLESLQDEEWADEEDGFKPSMDNNDSQDQDANHSVQELSLLDQILAMILGTLTPPSESDVSQQTDEHYFRYLRTEHEEVLVDWRNHFGRLPAATHARESDAWCINPGEVGHSQAQSSMLRDELGITDNDEEWDKSEDETEDCVTAVLNPRKSNFVSGDGNNQSDLASRGGGLRPGGSAMR